MPIDASLASGSRLTVASADSTDDATDETVTSLGVALVDVVVVVDDDDDVVVVVDAVDVAAAAASFIASVCAADSTQN